MEILLKRQTAIEERFHKKQSNRNAFALIESAWLLYKTAGDKSFLHKALHTAVTMTETNFSVAEFCFLRIFIQIELGNTDTAAELLDGLKPHKGYFKNHSPRGYAYYLFLLALLNQRNGKKRAAEKHYNLLSELNEPGENPLFDLLLGILNNAFSEYEDTVDFLSYAYKSGCRSAFLFQTALDCFQNAPKTITKFDAHLFFALTKWALQKGVDISALIQQFKNVIAAFFSAHQAGVEELYEKYPSGTLLKRICRERINRMDYSPRAFRYYKEAEGKQLDLPELYAALIKSASLNHDESLSRFTVDHYLKSQTADRELRAFVFHLMITKFKNSELYRGYEDEILAFAAESLRNRQSGRYYNSLYAVYLDSGKADGDLLQAAEKQLYEDLFKFRLYIDAEETAPKIRHVWISEKEQKEMRIYALSGRSRVIIASGEGFSIRFLEEEKRTVIDAPYRAVRLVETAGIDLYQRFFNQGLTSPELLIALANHYMTFEDLPAESLEIFKLAAANAFLSDSYRMVVKAAIGNYYANRGNYKTASLYYKEVDENSLNDRYLEQMLMAYVNGRDFDKAVGLIIKKAECISDRGLFYALKQMLPVKAYHKDLADVAYELTLKSWYDKALTTIVFQHYNGSLEEWQALSRALSAMSVSEQALDEIILKNALWMHVFDKGTQSVFWRMFDMNPENPLIADYATFCVYEIIIKGTKPEYETIELLEKLYERENDPMIAYALSHVYIRNDITTFRSEEMIKAAVAFAEKDRLIFPILKAVKDKTLLSAYIESNQPFIYRGLPGRTVKLFYKADYDAGFKTRTMQYVQFGLYFASIPSFYGDTLTYYFSEEMDTGSITTKQEQTKNNNMRLSENGKDPYYAINNALIYEQLFKYDMVEAIITERLKERPRIKGWII
ncbi:MAG: DUF5717 family protein [Clostridiales bacterium]|nr:DUF5717 family protein [Clostridiales bacterium]